MNEVANGAALVRDASDILLAMLNAVQENSAILSGLAASNQDQASEIAQLALAMRELEQFTQSNSDVVRQTKEAIARTEAQTGELDLIVDIFETNPEQLDRAAA